MAVMEISASLFPWDGSDGRPCRYEKAYCEAHSHS